MRNDQARRRAWWHGQEGQERQQVIEQQVRYATSRGRLEVLASGDKEESRAAQAADQPDGSQ